MPLDAVKISVFAKTPGFSKPKTRLARTIGEALALEFYELCARSVIEVLSDFPNVAWYTLESDRRVLEYWEGWRLPSGFEVKLARDAKAPLGLRLHEAYEDARGGAGVLLGTDAPQISKQELLALIRKLDTHDFAVIPARDGGFIAFAGRVPVRASVWTQTTYSSEHTLKELFTHLRGELPLAKIFTAAPLTDLDEESDIPYVKADLQRLPVRTPSQSALIARLP